MYYTLENALTIFLAIIGFVIVILAEVKIKNSYNKYKNTKCNSDLSGQEVARIILDNNNLSNIHVVEVKGNLTDHYDPSRKVIRLSSEVFHGTSIASVSIAAHEVGHAIQDKENYFLFNLRSMIVPIVNFITYIGYFVSIIAILVSITGYLKIGILIILATLVFQLVTLPVEFDASKRALIQLKKNNIVTEDEKKGSKDMLFAAAMTYVASFVSTILNLLRLIIILNDRDN